MQDVLLWYRGGYKTSDLYGQDMNLYSAIGLFVLPRKIFNAHKYRDDKLDLIVRPFAASISNIFILDAVKFGQTKSDQISETFDFYKIRYLKWTITAIFPEQFKVVIDVSE
ncbi:hypothetical protein TNCV_975111 [Trichonephila clavipes]|nr:hypothetical protein TNCV_975111 [Trichonephila clavipes]